MKKIRIKAYLIDFFVLFLALFIFLPKTEYVKELETEQNAIMEDFMSERITFSNYVENYGALYYESASEQHLNYFVYLITGAFIGTIQWIFINKYIF